MAADNIMPFEQVEDSWRQGYAGFAALYKDNVNALLAANQAAISGYQSISAELLAFLQSRMKNGLEASQRLASCSSPESMIELQVEYAKSAVKAYSDEVGRLGELTGEVLRQASAPVAGRARAVVSKAAESVAA
jgi:hypothetical protein